MPAKSFAYNILSSEWVLIIGLLLTLLDTSLILVAPHIGWCVVSTQASYEIPCRVPDQTGMSMHHLLLSVGFETIWIGPVMVFTTFATRLWMTRESLTEREDYETF